MNAKGVTSGYKWYQIPLTDEQRACLMRDIDEYFRCEELSSTGCCRLETVAVLTLLLCCKFYEGTRLLVYRGAPLLRVGEAPVLYRISIDDSWLYRNEPTEPDTLGGLQGPNLAEFLQIAEALEALRDETEHKGWPCGTGLPQTIGDLLCLHPWGRLSDDGSIRERTGIPTEASSCQSLKELLCENCRCSSNTSGRVQNDRHTPSCSKKARCRQPTRATCPHDEAGTV